MRKTSLLLFAFLLTLVSACKKEEDDSYTPPYVPPYRVENLIDITLQKVTSGAASYQMLVSLAYENGEQERVALSLEGVPTGLKDSILTPSGYPTFSSAIRLIDSGVAEGTYALKLVCTGTGSGRREYPFNVRVLPVPNCSAQIPGTYTGSGSCVSGGAYSVSVQASPSVPNRILLSNFNNAGLQLYANVQCNSSGGGSGPLTLNVPSQSINGVSYSGYGTYYPASATGGQTNISMYISQSNLGSCSYYFIR